jgi:thioesterase domain-containing protein
MAVRLRESGDEVAFLGILDSYWQPREMLPASTRDKEYHFTNIRRLRGWMKAAYILTRIGLKLERIRDRSAAAVSSRILGRGGTLPGPLRKWYINSYIPAVNRDAEKMYSPPVFDGRMTFFQASSETQRDPREFWGTLTRQELDVLTVQSSHRDILVEPNVSKMAAALRDALERVLAGRREGGDREGGF